MTEKEKRDGGLLYDANNDEALIRERLACKELCFRYNALPPSGREERETIIRRLFGRARGRFLIEPQFWCDYGYNISIGDNFYSNHNCVILDCAAVTFGDDVMIGPNCGFYTAAHPLDIARRSEGLEYALPIAVGDDVWIGGNVAVMPGVTIGCGTVVGAGSVVTKDLPPGVVAVGNPCRVLRKVEK